jgi:MscS family membrane protein
VSGGSFDVVVERVGRGTTPPVWLFSRKTLTSIPGAYAEVNLVPVERFLPNFISRPRIAGIRVFEWFVLLVFVPVFYRLLRVLDWAFRPLMRWWHRRTGALDDESANHVPGLAWLVLIAIAIRWSVANLDLPLLERQFWSAIATILTITAFGWALFLVNGYGEAYIQRRFGHGGETASLLRLARRAADVLVVSACVLATLRYFGFDPTAALAGLGIGGLAVALAAQKTLENVIAGVSLIFDKAVRVGDALKFGDTVGTVDYIGLRSTRIRTLDRTILTVPNGQIASVALETLSTRDKYWFHHFVGLHYETAPDQMREVIDSIEKLLVAHPNVDGGSAKVRFLRIAASSLDVEISAYVFAADMDRFLAVQQELLLRIMEIVDAAGTAIAIPSQTLRISERRTSEPEALAALPGSHPSGARAEPASPSDGRGAIR